MEDIFEMILEVMLSPFESKYDELFLKLKKIPQKPLRVLVEFLLLVLPFAVIVGISFLIDHIF